MTAGDPTPPVNTGVMPSTPTITVQEAAALLDVSPTAIRRRCDRGTLEAVVEHGQRRILVSSLPTPADTAPDTGAGTGSTPADTAPDTDPIAAILIRYERAVAELGKVRAIAEIAESTATAAESEMLRLRAENTELKARLEAAAPRRRWWRRTPAQAPAGLPEPQNAS